jgi:hypothetical protein
MHTHTHFKADATSVANGFLLLAMVAGVLNIHSFERDSVSAYSDHRVLYRIELVFNVKRPGTQSTVLPVSECISGNEIGESRVSLSYPTSFTLFSKQNIGQVSARPLYSSHDHTRLFNIPHQNSDEDEVFISGFDVA